MGTPVSSIRNLGPATEQAFASVGIHTAEQVVELGADTAYARLIGGGTQPHFIGYYALVMGLQGRPWNDCHGAEKEALRTHFDAIKEAQAKSQKKKGHAHLDAALAEIGVIEKKA